MALLSRLALVRSPFALPESGRSPRCWELLDLEPIKPEQAKREQPVRGPHVAWIQKVLEKDKKYPRKQRHTAKRIFDRLHRG